MDTGAGITRGRQAEARRNDARILEAALDVFSHDPAAPMSAVARYAEVGQASLYRRYPSKEALLVEVCGHGLTRIADAARHGLAAHDAWAGMATFLEWYATSGTLRMATLLGSFDPPTVLFDIARNANRDIQALVDRAHSANLIRPAVTGADLTLIATQIGALATGDRERTRQLRRRYLALALQSLALIDAQPLPGPAPDAAELEAPWEERRRTD